MLIRELREDVISINQYHGTNTKIIKGKWETKKASFENRNINGEI